MKAIVFSVCVCLSLVYLSADQPKGKEPAATKPPSEALKKKVDRPSIAGKPKEVFQKIEKLGELKIEPDWGVLRATGVKEDGQFTISASEATVEQLLELALVKMAAKEHPLAWYQDGGVIRVSTQLRVLYRERLPLVTVAPAAEGAKAQATVSRVTKADVRDMNFDNLALEDVIGFLRDVTGANIYVNWKALEMIKVDRKTPVTVRAKEVSFAKALDMVVDQLGEPKDKYDRVYWVLDEGVVTISTGTALNVTMKTKVFDVADVLVIVPNFKAPRIDIRGSESSTTTDQTNTGNRPIFVKEETTRTGELEEESVLVQRKALQEGLTGAIKDSIGDDMWQPNGKGGIRLFRNNLIISQTLLGFKLLETSGTVK